MRLRGSMKELAGHEVAVDEAVDVSWNGFDVHRNKGYHGGDQLIGRTDGGRRLKFESCTEKQAVSSRTGWDIDARKKLSEAKSNEG